MHSGEAAAAPQPLRLFFLPWVAAGHMIPMVDMARVFASRGADVTIITTPYNALLFRDSIDRDFISGHPIRLHLFTLPTTEVGLPEGCENFSSLPSLDMAPKLFLAISMLQQPIDHLFQQRRPDAIISDIYYPWTADAASRLGIPRLVFHGSFFFLCASDTIQRYAPHKDVSSDTDNFLLSGLPDPIEMTRLQLPDWVRVPNEYTVLMDRMRESEERSYGAAANTFYELEHTYVEHYRKALGKKAWHVGPVSLCNKDTADKAERGNKAVVDQDKCLSWLDCKRPNSVLYVSFGSMTQFPAAQLLEIALGLEASGHPFIWVVKKGEQEDERCWLPEGFEERMMEGDKGLIIRGWAPQVLILDHPAIGGFVTHCGWNSILESVIAGLPMITWPVFAEQFYNEKLVTRVLRIGIGVGVESWASLGSEQQNELVKGGRIEEAVKWLMDDGGEAEEMRKRAREMGETAKRAVEQGGSSYASMTDLMDELKLHRAARREKENGKPNIVVE